MEDLGESGHSCRYEEKMNMEAKGARKNLRVLLGLVLETHMFEFSQVLVVFGCCEKLEHSKKQCGVRPAVFKLETGEIRAVQHQKPNNSCLVAILQR